MCVLSADTAPATGCSGYLEEQGNFSESLAWWLPGKPLRQVFRVAMGCRYRPKFSLSWSHQTEFEL